MLSSAFGSESVSLFRCFGGFMICCTTSYFSGLNFSFTTIIFVLFHLGFYSRPDVPKAEKKQHDYVTFFHFRNSERRYLYTFRQSESVSSRMAFLSNFTLCFGVKELNMAENSGSSSIKISFILFTSFADYETNHEPACSWFIHRFHGAWPDMVTQTFHRG